jgi:hypothetical protein
VLYFIEKDWLQASRTDTITLTQADSIDAFANYIARDYLRLLPTEFHNLETNCPDTQAKIKWMIRRGIVWQFSRLLLPILFVILPYCIFQGIRGSIGHWDNLVVLILALLALMGSFFAGAVTAKSFLVDRPWDNPILSGLLLGVLNGPADFLAAFLFFYKGLWRFVQLKDGFSMGTIVMCLLFMLCAQRIYKAASTMETFDKALWAGAIPRLSDEADILFPPTAHASTRDLMANLDSQKEQDLLS